MSNEEQYEIIQHPIFEKELLRLPEQLRIETQEIIDFIKEYGLKNDYIDPKDIEKIKNTKYIYEIRAGKKNISRTLFAYKRGRKVYFLACFVKKSPKLPIEKLKLTRDRLYYFKDFKR